jgi:hypothetical protein
VGGEGDIAHRIDAQFAAGIERPVEVEPLCDEDRILNLKDVTGPVAGVIGAPSGVIEDNVFVGHPLRQRVAAHRLRLVVVNYPYCTTS